MANQRYQSDPRTSTFNLHTLLTKFVDEYGLEGSVNLLDNPQLEDQFIDTGSPIWDVWDYTDFVSFTKPDTRFLLTKSAAPAVENLRQDITAKVAPGSTYTLIFKGVIEEDCLIEVVGGPYDILNPDDLTEVGSSTATITGSADEIYTVVRFQTAENMSANPVLVRFSPTGLNTYIRFDKVILKEGWMEVSDLFSRSFLERSVRYNETSEIWEITSDNGVSYEQFGSSVSGDVYAAIADMVVSNVENGISVYYTSGDQKLNFDVGDFTLTFIGDASGSGTITNLGNESITIEVVDDSHNHTTATITDFAAGVNAGIDTRINDGGVATTDLWSADKITTELGTRDTAIAGKEPTFSKETGFNLPLGTGASTVSEGDHIHDYAAPLKRYKSTAFALTLNTIVQFPHGLTGSPWKAWLGMRCISPELGYVVDEWVFNPLLSNVDAGPVNVKVDSTNVSFASGDSALRVINHIADFLADWSTIDPAKWQLHLFVEFD